MLPTTRDGNVFTGVCPSVHMGEGVGISCLGLVQVGPAGGRVPPVQVLSRSCDGSERVVTVVGQ